MEKMIQELRAAGYTEEQIAKEVRYYEYCTIQNERMRTDPNCNFGFMGPPNEDDQLTLLDISY